MKRLTLIGLAITGSWALVVVVILCLQFTELGAMTLNEWGDFLAGATAPLALFWLVIGYFQHSAELRLNTRALKMQEEELRRQVEETARLVEATKEQAEAASQDLQDRRQRDAREATPEFIDHGGGSSGDKLDRRLLNRGGEARNIELHYEGPHNIDVSPKNLVETGDHLNLKVIYGDQRPLMHPIKFGIRCIDRLGNIHCLQIDLTAENRLEIIR
ncbi:MAG: hypothetical protein OXH64_05395, partial [Rhodospirillaceae bacterium]|nr:hypothetical protein [Rhodospirillaceae bacterium]